MIVHWLSLGSNSGSDHAASNLAPWHRCDPVVGRRRGSDARSGRIRSSGARLFELHGPIRRPRPLRRPMRSGAALPRLEFRLSDRSRPPGCVLAQKRGRPANPESVLYFRREGVRRDRAAARHGRVLDRPHWRRFSQFRDQFRSDRADLCNGLRGRRALPRVDLFAPWLSGASPMLSEGSGDQAAPPTLLRVRRRQVIGFFQQQSSLRPGRTIDPSLGTHYWRIVTRHVGIGGRLRPQHRLFLSNPRSFRSQ